MLSFTDTKRVLLITNTGDPPTMQAELHVYYSNGTVDNFCGTKIFTASNLRRWAKALVQDEDIDSATLYVKQDDGTETPEYY